MNLRPQRREREETNVNLTPLIDVVFLLLIFFMVSTTFRKEADFDIELPEAFTESAPIEQRRLQVSIDKDGHYSVNEQGLPGNDIETLKSALIKAAGDNRKLPFVIRADAATAHQAVVRVMDAAGQLGFKKLAIATIQFSDSSGNR